MQLEQRWFGGVLGAQKLALWQKMPDEKKEAVARLPLLVVDKVLELLFNKAYIAERRLPADAMSHRQDGRLGCRRCKRGDR